MSEFFVGGRVKCIYRYGEGASLGDTGTIVRVDDRLIKVRWDEKRKCRHSCGGLCEIGYGWNVPRANIEAINDVVDLGIFLCLTYRASYKI